MGARSRRFGVVAVVLVVLIGLLLVADAVARRVAERAVASELRTSQGLSSTPQVRLAGFPFLVNAVRGSYPQVEVQVENVDTGRSLQLDRVDVALEGVQVPLGDVLRGSVDRIPADRGEARARVGFDTLQDAVAQELPTGADLQLAAGDGNRVRVSGTLPLPIGTVPVDTIARLSIRDGDLRVSVPASGLQELPGAVRTEVAQALDLTIALPQLPLGLRPAGVAVSQDGVTLRATGRNLVLQAGSTGSTPTGSTSTGSTSTGSTPTGSTL